MATHDAAVFERISAFLPSADRMGSLWWRAFARSCLQTAGALLSDVLSVGGSAPRLPNPRVMSLVDPATLAACASVNVLDADEHGGQIASLEACGLERVTVADLLACFPHSPDDGNSGLSFFWGGGSRDLVIRTKGILRRR